MINQEDNMVLINEFFEKADCRVLVVYVASNGQLTPMITFPTTSKNKAVYYIKRVPDTLKKDNILQLLQFGDMSYVPLDQLSSLVDSVRPLHLHT